MVVSDREFTCIFGRKLTPNFFEISIMGNLNVIRVSMLSNIVAIDLVPIYSHAA